MPARAGCAVGCAILTDKGIVTGANIEGPWETSIHAEMSAIGNMPGIGATKIKAVALAAGAGFIMPCGACLDWLLYLAEENAELALREGEAFWTVPLTTLYPAYPSRRRVK